MSEIIHLNVLSGTLLNQALHTFKLQTSKPGALTLDFTHPAGMTAGERIDVTVHDPDGNVVLDESCLANAKFQVTIAVAGNYTVTIRDGNQSRDDGGVYALRPTLSSEDNTVYDGAANNTVETAIPAALAMPIVGTLGLSDKDYFVVEAPAGGQLHLFFAHPAGAGDNGAAVLLDVTHVATGETVMQEWLTGSDLLLETLESGGRYSISLASGYWSEIDTSFYGVLASITDAGGSDFIAGTDAGDTFRASAANDTFSGLDGMDAVVYDGQMASYQLTFSAAGVVVGAGAAPNGTDTLFSIERLQFSDKTVDLGIHTPAAQVYRLYDAAFERRSDETGLGFWVNAAELSSLDAIAQSFMQSAEFRAMYPAISSDRDNIRKFYENVLDRPADAAGLDYWVQARESGATMSAVLVAISESPEHQILLAGQTTHGVTYIPLT